MDTAVTILQITVSQTSNGRQKYDVACGDGVTRTCWESNIANALNAFAGTNQQVTIRWSEKQNGQFTNRTIHAFAPPGQAMPPDTGQGGRPQGGGGGGFRGGGGMTPDDKTRITKMGAQGSAATVVAALFTSAGPEAYNEAVELLDRLTVKLYKAARSHEKPETAVLQTGTQGEVLPQGGNVLPVAGQPVVLPQATTGAEIAAAVPGVTVGTDSLAPQAAAEESQAPANDGDIDWT